MTEATLTFDNGPDPEATPAVLDILKNHGIHATFFVIGDKLRKPGARALAERARDEGHWLGNHTLTHSATFGTIEKPEQARAEILETERLLGDLAHPDRLFRPYGGGGHIGPHLLSDTAIACMEERAMTCIAWTSVPGDWKDPDGWVDKALADCRAMPAPVIVLHDIAGAAVTRLSNFLDRARRGGARFVQAFPDDVVLIRAGQATRDLAPFTTRG